jgi:hypothetical protein
MFSLINWSINLSYFYVSVQWRYRRQGHVSWAESADDPGTSGPMFLSWNLAYVFVLRVWIKVKDKWKNP